MPFPFLQRRARMRIDLNADAGESFGAWAMGDDSKRSFLDVTSVNIACGFHAGDPAVIRRTLALARAAGRVASARTRGIRICRGSAAATMALTPGEVEDLVALPGGGAPRRSLARAKASRSRTSSRTARSTTRPRATRRSPRPWLRRCGSRSRPRARGRSPVPRCATAAGGAAARPSRSCVSAEAVRGTAAGRRPDHEPRPSSPAGRARREAGSAADGGPMCGGAALGHSRRHPGRGRTARRAACASSIGSASHGDTPRLALADREAAGRARRSRPPASPSRPRARVRDDGRRGMALSWWRTAPASARRRALVAASLGWMLDAMDVLLYSFVLDDVRREFALTDRDERPAARAAAGGVRRRRRAVRVARRPHRPHASADGLDRSSTRSRRRPAASRSRSHNSPLCRVVLGLGMGGEWATGAALVAETWPATHRGKALGVHAERVGDRLCGRRRRQRAGAAAAGAGAACFFAGVAAGAAHALDPARRSTSRRVWLEAGRARRAPASRRPLALAPAVAPGAASSPR